MNSMLFWTREDAIRLCTYVEAFAPSYGCHVAMTGGLLYKEGPRKDLDIIFYRIRQCEFVDWEGLFERLWKEGIYDFRHFGFVVKALFAGKGVDILRPEWGQDSDYDASIEQESRHEIPMVSEMMRQNEITGEHPALIAAEF